MKMGHVQFVARLGAPLATRTSWGSVRASDGVVFLLLWQDQQIPIDGAFYFRVQPLEEWGTTNPSYQERLEHVKLIQNGRSCYLILCDPSEPPEQRRVKDYKDDKLFIGGELKEHDGGLWIRLGPAVESRDVRLPPS